MWNAAAAATTNIFDGDYNKLTNKPTIPTRLQDLQQDENYYTTVSKAERDKWNTASDRALFTGSYNDLTNKPTFAPVAVSGSYNDLTDKPSFDFTIGSDSTVQLATVALTGDYNDLINKPTFNLGGDGNVTLATVATTGSYNDLLDKPAIPTSLLQLAQDDNYAMYVTKAEKDIWNAKADVAQIPTQLNQLAQDDNYAMYVTKAEKEAWNAKANVSQIITELRYMQQDDLYAMYVSKAEKDAWNALVSASFFDGNYANLTNKPALATVATTGDYNDLGNRPTIPTNLSQLQQTDDAQYVTKEQKQSLNSIVDAILPDDAIPSGGDITGTYGDMHLRSNVVLGGGATLSASENTNLNSITSSITNLTSLIAFIEGNGNIYGINNLGVASIQMVAALLKALAPTLNDARVPKGTAGGDLSGSYPNPTIKSGVTLSGSGTGAPKLATSPVTTTDVANYFSTMKNKSSDKSIVDLASVRNLLYTMEVINEPKGTIKMWNSATPPNSCWEIMSQFGGRFPIGAGSLNDGGTNYTYSYGNVGGETKHQLTITEMPSHSHTAVYTRGVRHSDNGTSYNPISGFVQGTVSVIGTNDNGNVNGGQTNTTGGNTYHENRPPYFAVYFIRKVKYSWED